MNVDTADLGNLAEQVAALSRKVSTLSGRVTALANMLDGEGGLTPVVAAYRLGWEQGGRATRLFAEPAPQPRHLRTVR